MTELQQGEPGPACQLESFYDGACPLCAREVRLLSSLDKDQTIRFVDISAPSFNADQVGKPVEALMGKMHARTADGQWISGVDTFRAMYEAVGFRRAVWLSRRSGISWLLDKAYNVFAKHRLALTGRTPSKVGGLV